MIFCDNIKEISKKNEGMIFVKLDGYSKAKTLKGAVADLKREVAKFDKGESDFIEYDDNIRKCLGTHGNGDEWFMEIEAVDIASRYIDSESDELEYADANFYCHINFFINLK